ncbi:MAG: polymerase subunit alpha, Gram-positive type [Kosmotogales bacterium]|nr:polymerase subunit alpha, Gram-positive type [Kosmotogales bacterium]
MKKLVISLELKNRKLSDLYEKITGYLPDENYNELKVEKININTNRREIVFYVQHGNKELNLEKLNEEFKGFFKKNFNSFIKVIDLENRNENMEFNIESFYEMLPRILVDNLKVSKVELKEDKFFIGCPNEFIKDFIIKHEKELEENLQKYFSRSISYEIYLEEYKLKEEDIIPPEIAEEIRTVKKEKSKKIILGRKINEIPRPLNRINENDQKVTVSGEIVEIDSRTGRFSVITFVLTDYTSSITCKAVGEDAKILIDNLSEGDEVIIRGFLDNNDKYIKERYINVKDLSKSSLKKRKDMSEEKRVELHLHTKMSMVDATTDIKKLFKTLKDWGHDSVALTDHGVVQSIPEFYFTAKKFDIKPIFGMEGYLVNDSEPIYKYFTDEKMRMDEAVYTVFDLETTGFESIDNEIIEVGAVKMQGERIMETFSAFVKPKQEIPQKVTEITGINYEMVKDAESDEKVLRDFLEFSKNTILVAHNANFDYSFIKNVIRSKINGEWDMPIIDTLILSRSLVNLKSHSLDKLINYFKLGDFEHHRASEDARVTAQMFLKLQEIAKKKGIEKIWDFDSLRNKEVYKKAPRYHITMLATNETGLKNLYKLVSISHTEDFYFTPRVFKSILDKYRKGLLIGSACVSGLLSQTYLSSVSERELEETAKYFDYIEIMPLDIYGGVKKETMKDMYREFYRIGKKFNIPVVMTGDVHYIEPHEELFRSVIQAAEKGREETFDKQPPLYLRTTEEMLEKAYEIFEDEKIAKEIVIDNTRKIASRIKELIPVKGVLNPPKIDGAEEKVRNITYETARKIYGEPLPEIVLERIKVELHAIIDNGYAVLYLIAADMVKKSNEDGYIVGSRGSVGSSLVANLMGITEVNPLLPHYICSNCKYSEFVEEPYYESGYDLPRKECPHCGMDLQKNGQRIPFETFLGFGGGKVPDIDLNFSGEYQERSHRFLEEMFGRDHVFRAGTIGTLAEKTAYGFINAYTELKGTYFTNAEKRTIVKNLVGVKRTTGQHPGGLVIVPKDREIYEFSPYQFPANDKNSRTYTTHFAYEYIHDDLIKMDALGHDDPTFIKMLGDLTGVDPTKIPMDDSDTLSIFNSLDKLNLQTKNINTTVGTLGVPEFGTYFVRSMLEDTRPKSFGELVRISGLSHGTNVWVSNSKDLIASKRATLSQVIACRDDIMNYLISKKIDPEKSFKIMEKVRKGKGLNDEEIKLMQKYNVPEWFVDSCQKIKYLFPKAHAAAYVSMGYRVAYFKVHYPIAYYASYFSIRGSEFDIKLAINGVSAINNELSRLRALPDKNVKDFSRESCLEVTREMLLRGYNFLPVDLYKSEANNFVIEDEKYLRVPFNRLPNLGTKAAFSIIDERSKRPFSSVEDLLKRTLVNKTALEVLREFDSLKGMPELDQLNLFG